MKMNKENSYEKYKNIDHECLGSNGRCVYCGRETENPHDKEQEKFYDEINLTPQMQKIFDYAVNYANKYSMYMSGQYKPTLVELDQFKSDRLTVTLDVYGNIIGVKVYEEEKEDE